METIFALFDEYASALHDFGVPRDVAADFQAGIVEGGVLLWVRTEDQRAPAAANVLRDENGKHVAAHGGS